MLQNSNSHSAMMSSSSQQKKQRPKPVKGYKLQFDNTKRYSLTVCIEQSVVVLNGLKDDIKWEFNAKNITSTREKLTYTFEITNEPYEEINFEIALVFVQSIVDILTHFYILKDDKESDIQNVQTQINKLIENVFGKHKRSQDRKQAQKEERELLQAIAQKQKEEQEQDRKRLLAIAKKDRERLQAIAKKDRELLNATAQKQKEENDERAKAQQDFKSIKEAERQVQQNENIIAKCSKQQIIFLDGELTKEEVNTIIIEYVKKYDWSPLNYENEYNKDKEAVNGIFTMLILYNLMMNQSVLLTIMSLDKTTREALFTTSSMQVYKKYIFVKENMNVTILDELTDLYHSTSCTSGSSCQPENVGIACKQFTDLFKGLLKQTFLKCFDDSILKLMPDTYDFRPKLLTYLRIRGDGDRYMNENNKFRVTQYKHKPNYLFTYLNNDVQNTYVSGPFTNVFYEEIGNKKVADKCTEITSLLTKNESVFVVGYGSSGAGKTSSLINYRHEINGKQIQEPGILLKIIDNLKDVNTIQMNLYEDYYGTTTYNRNVFEFTKNTQTQIFELTQEHKGSIQISKKTSLGDCIIKLVDEPEQRRIAATTNNVQSSRSHVIVKLTLINMTSNESANMYIADYAGVENIFSCSSLQELIKFANIKSNRGTNGLFYNASSPFIMKDIQFCKEKNKIGYALSEAVVINPNLYDHFKNQIFEINGTIKYIENKIENDLMVLKDELNTFEKTILKNNNFDLDEQNKIIKTFDAQITNQNNIYQNYTNNKEKHDTEEQNALAFFKVNINDKFKEQINKIPIEITLFDEMLAYNVPESDISYKLPNKYTILKENWTKLNIQKTLLQSIILIDFNKKNFTVWDVQNEVTPIHTHNPGENESYLRITETLLYDKKYKSVDHASTSKAGTTNKFSVHKLKYESIRIELDNNVVITLSDKKKIPRTEINDYVYYKHYFDTRSYSDLSFEEVYTKCEITLKSSGGGGTEAPPTDWVSQISILKNIHDYYKKCVVRLNEIRKVCKCRAGEGMHINKSIEIMRNHIFTLLNADKQNRSATYPKCTNGLFPVLQDRFVTTNSTQQTSENNAMKIAIGDDKTNINIVVFGVFNNSPSQEDKTLYVDINKLKYWYNCFYINEQYNLATVPHIPIVLREFLKDYLNTTNILHNIGNEINTIKDLNSTKTLNLEQRTIHSKIVGYINSISKDINSVEEIKGIIDMIQRENNTSPLGTLEFMDHMSKINSEIKPVCTTDFNKLPDDIKYGLKLLVTTGVTLSSSTKIQP